MKKVLLIILVITAMLIVLVSCGKDDPSNTTIVTTMQITTTSAISTTAAEIYTPEDAYPNQYYGYMMTLGDSHISYGYIPKSEYESLNPISIRKAKFEKDGVEYVLIPKSSYRAAYEDYTVGVFHAYNPEVDDINKSNQKSYILYYRRDSGKLVGMLTPSVRTHSDDKCYLGEIGKEDVTYTYDELADFAKKMAKEYIEKFGLDMKVDECVLIYEDVIGSFEKYGDYYYFHKCLDGVPTGEYVRVDVSSNGKCWGVQSAGIGMYDEFANAKIDIDAIKSRTSNIKNVILLNDEGTLVAKIDYEVYEENYPDAAKFGDPEYIWREYTKYRPLVPKEIEKE